MIKRNMKFYNIQITIQPEDNPKDGFFAYSPQLPGVYSNGNTLDEVRQNMREAIQLHLAAIQENRKSPVGIGSSDQQIEKS